MKGFYHIYIYIYIGNAAILVMCPGCYKQTFVPPNQGGSTYNLALIGQAGSEEKMLEIVDGDPNPDDRWTESLMLHIKFRENRPAGSGEEDF